MLYKLQLPPPPRNAALFTATAPNSKAMLWNFKDGVRNTWPKFLPCLNAHSGGKSPKRTFGSITKLIQDTDTKRQQGM